LLTRLLTLQNRLTEARAELTKGLKLAKNVQEVEPHFDLDIASAELEMATGDDDQARTTLVQVSKKAETLGYRRYDLRSRLVSAQLEAKENSPDARAHLAALQRDAKARGFQLIMHKANFVSDSLALASPRQP